MNNIEVCFSPALFEFYNPKDSIIVIVDILRATTSICTALDYGVKEIIPVATIDDAKEKKMQGYLVAAERDGNVLDFADTGNSPYDFQKKEFIGKSIAYSTTNGTQAIIKSSKNNEVIIGAFININEVYNYLKNTDKDVFILCAGWKNRFNLEDTLFAGALSEMLLKSGNYSTICDSVFASIDLWKSAEDNLLGYVEKCAHRHRLKKLKLDDVIPYCFTLNSVDVVPVFKNGKIIKSIN